MAELNKGTVQEQTPSGPFFCEQCTARFALAGDCPHCPEEPLLDLRDEDVRHMLINFDQARMRKRMGIYGAISGAVTFPVFFFLLEFIGLWLDLALWILMAAGLSTLLMTMLPPKRKCPKRSEMPA